MTGWTALRRALADMQPPLTDALGRAIPAAAWADALIDPLTDRGLAHLHLRLVGTGWLARIPKQSQMRLAAADNLHYQAACFARAAPSGHVPRLHAVLSPRSGLPHGALVVEEIVGRPAQLPRDLPALLRSLASVHALPVPQPAEADEAAGATEVAPLLWAADPLRDLLHEIEAQTASAMALDRGPADREPSDLLPSCAQHALHAGLADVRALCEKPSRPPRCLIAFDGHPGNFVLRSDGRAMLVDLEKCRYSHPGLDLAHATLYTSTTWDTQVSAVLSSHEIENAYAAWEQAVPPALATAARPWHAPLAQAMWLWSLSWCAQWLVLSQRPPRADADGEDWSAAHSDPALVAHVRERVLHYLSPQGLAAAQRGIQALRRWVAHTEG